MRSLLGLRAKSTEPSPLEGSGAFRALQTETELRQLGRREWWLWFWTFWVTLLSATALVLSFLPFLFRQSFLRDSRGPGAVGHGRIAANFQRLVGVPAMVFSALPEEIDRGAEPVFRTQRKRYLRPFRT
jgi:hypothetical protein